MASIFEFHFPYTWSESQFTAKHGLIKCELVKVSLSKRATGTLASNGRGSDQAGSRDARAFTWKQATSTAGGHHREMSALPRGDKALTVEIEDEEAAIGKVAVKLEQDLIGGTVRRLQGCVSTENSELRRILIGTIPEKEERQCEQKGLATASTHGRLSSQSGCLLGKAG